MDKILKEIYYDPEKGLGGVDALYKRAKVVDKTIKKADVKEWLRKQATAQIHLTPKETKHYWPIKSNYKDHIWQADLLDVSAQAHNNRGINWLLCVIDIYTRYAWVIPLKNKEGPTVLDGFKRIVAEAKTVGHSMPEVLMSDNGSEFIARKFKAYLKEHDVKPSYSEPGDHHRQGIVERFNKNIRGKVTTYMTAYKRKNWVDELPKLVKNYNTSPHTALGGSTPSNPDPKRIASRLAQREFRAAQEQTQYKVGDQVRYLLNKKMFEKGAIPKYSKEVHKVVEEVGQKRYKLDGTDKTFLYYQIKPANDVEEFDPPEVAKPSGFADEEKKEVIEPLKKEGVERTNIREGLRERKPTVQLQTKYGEKVNW